MKWIKKMWRKVMIWWFMQQANAGKDIKELLKKGAEKIKVEENLACQHDVLTKVLPNDSWYQCKKCKMVVFINNAPLWDVKGVRYLSTKLLEALKEPKKEKKCKKKK